MVISHIISGEFPNLNDRLVIRCLASEGRPMIRDEIARCAGMPHTTTFDTLQRLVMRNIVDVENELRKTVGRPKRLYALVTQLSDHNIMISPVRMKKLTTQQA